MLCLAPRTAWPFSLFDDMKQIARQDDEFCRERIDENEVWSLDVIGLTRFISQTDREYLGLLQTRKRSSRHSTPRTKVSGIGHAAKQCSQRRKEQQ